jgi:crossover junction endodeoxyribonuclease RuvC
MTAICGIDPGQTGGLALISQHGIAVDVMPDISLFATWIGVQKRGWGNLHVFIEKAQTMPKQGIASAFNYGRHFGELLGVLVAYSIPHTLVPPATWTRQMHLGCTADKPKGKSLEACQRLFPEVNLIPGKKRKPHDGIIDALLLAEFGRRQIGKAV